MRVTGGPYGYVFSPSSKTVNNLSGDQTLDFTAVRASVISGYVKDANGVGIPGATVSYSGSQTGTIFSYGDGFYGFAVPVDGTYTITPSAFGYAFSPASRTLGNLSGDAPNTNFVATRAINPIDDAQTFVRQHYLDFLNRDPDSGGLDYWTGLINQCSSSDTRCINSKRVSVSAAFFVELEFQETGGYVYRFYKASYGQRPTYAQFNADRSKVVGGANLDAGKQSFADAWVQRAEFLQKYPADMSPGAFVDQLILTVKTTTNGIADLSNNRAGYLNALQQGGGRAQLLRQIVDDAAFKQAEYNNAFVLMQYFGYLRRDPEADGYKFWLDVLNNRAANNYRGMVCAFLTSAEYQYRFGTVQTRNDSICGQIGQ